MRCPDDIYGLFFKPNEHAIAYSNMFNAGYSLLRKRFLKDKTPTLSLIKTSS